MAIDKPCALITGAGRGLGRAIAETFHRNGYHVVATDYDESMFDDLRGAEDFTFAALDVTSEQAAAEVADRIGSELGRLDVIVNNAGVNAFYPVVEAPPSMTIQAFMINTFGPLIITQACLDLLIANRATVVNIASESSPFRSPFQYYQSTKMALEALSDVMRRELGLFDCHVSFVRPGAIQTELFEGARNIKNAVENSRFESFFNKFTEGVAKRVPKNPSSPAEVAAVVYLAATDPKKKVMYTINNSLFLKIMARLPAKLADKLLIAELKG